MMGFAASAGSPQGSQTAAAKRKGGSEMLPPFEFGV
jgi:hypothetical protein